MSGAGEIPAAEGPKKKLDIAVGFAICGVLFSLLIFLFMLQQERDASIHQLQVSMAQTASRLEQIIKRPFNAIDSVHAYLSLAEAEPTKFEQTAAIALLRAPAIKTLEWQGTDVVQRAAEGQLLPADVKLTSELQGQKVTLFTESPLQLLSETALPKSNGRLVAIISMAQLQSAEAEQAFAAIHLLIDDHNIVLADTDQALALDSALELPLSIAGAKWRVQITATEEQVSAQMGSMPGLFLMSGLLLSFLVASYLRRTSKHLENLRHQHEVMADQMIDTSWHDPLTGLVNRIHFDEALEVECRRAVREFSPLTLMMIRIDHYDDYLEHYGPDAGDILIQQIAEQLRGSVGRPGDMIARLDGALFGFILPSTNELVAQLAERCTDTISELAIPHDNNEATAEKVVSVSIGVATLQPSRLLTSQRLFEITAEQLELAAEEGNRFQAFAENTLEPSVTYSV